MCIAVDFLVSLFEFFVFQLYVVAMFVSRRQNMLSDYWTNQ